MGSRLQTVCKHGHEYTSDNTGHDNKGHRYCKTCKRLQGRYKIAFRGHAYGDGVCKHGHVLDEVGAYDRNDGYLRCRICSLNKDRKRRDRRMNLDTNYTTQDQEYTFWLFGSQCFKCHTTEDLEIDHHYPLSKGFGLTRNNAVLLCKSCNTSKSDKNPEEFYSPAQIDQLSELLTSGFAV